MYSPPTGNVREVMLIIKEVQVFQHSPDTFPVLKSPNKGLSVTHSLTLVGAAAMRGTD